MTQLGMTLLALIVCLWAYALLMRLIRVCVSFAAEVLDTAVALVFFVLIVPPLWLWEKGRRPMWRTLTQQESEELRAWLKLTASPLNCASKASLKPPMR